MNTRTVYSNGVLVECLRNEVPQQHRIGEKLNDGSLWPFMLRPLKLLAIPSDKGLGDIVERVIGPIGGDAYKAWYEKAFGKPCKCTKRQDGLNERFPLNNQPTL